MGGRGRKKDTPEGVVSCACGPDLALFLGVGRRHRKAKDAKAEFDLPRDLAGLEIEDRDHPAIAVADGCDAIESDHGAGSRIAALLIGEREGVEQLSLVEIDDVECALGRVGDDSAGKIAFDGDLIGSCGESERACGGFRQLQPVDPKQMCCACKKKVKPERIGVLADGRLCRRQCVAEDLLGGDIDAT